MRIIAGIYKGRALTLPKESLTRPTGDRAREAVFNILSNRLHQTAVLDLFAGSGALGVEALSRGAASAVFVELDRKNGKALEENLTRLGITAGQVITGDFRQVGRRLAAQKRRFGLILLDPPYEADYYFEALSLARELLADGGTIVVEHDRRWTSPEAVSGLIREDLRLYGRNAMSFYRMVEYESMDLPGQL